MLQKNKFCVLFTRTGQRIFHQFQFNSIIIAQLIEFLYFYKIVNSVLASFRACSNFRSLYIRLQVTQDISISPHNDAPIQNGSNKKIE